jgi:hypothetical protein
MSDNRRYKIKSLVRSGIPTPNGNIYPPGLLQAAFAKAAISPIGLLGTLGQDGERLRVADVSHKIIACNEKGNGEIEVEVEVLATPSGNKLKELLEKGRCLLRVAPRGCGSTKLENGVVIVQSDYILESLDVTTSHFRRPEECSCPCHQGEEIFCSCFSSCCDEHHKQCDGIVECIACRGAGEKHYMVSDLREHKKTCKHWLETVEKFAPKCSVCGKPNHKPQDHAGWHPDDDKRG